MLRPAFGLAASAFALSLAMPANAQTPTDPDETAQGDVSVTIYSDGRALVQDVRQIDIPRGRSTIEFPDVSARIQAQTLSFNAAGAGIIEQNFDYDILTPAKLMEKHVGKQVTLVRTNPATGAVTRENATVLSVAGGVVVRIGDRIEVLKDDGLPVRVVFDRVPSNLRARPTLSVTVDSAQGGRRPASIRYLTPGLNWGADYVALYDENGGLIDMQGWVTLQNNTGTTFHNADTLLVAGGAGSGVGSYGNAQVDPGTETADREQLGDFYLYPLPGRTTIAQAQTKQVSFLDVQGVPARKIYARGVGWLTSDRRPMNVTSQLAFSTSRTAGLGDALPQGTVRFYQRDAQGNPQFVGEDNIGHTPMGSMLTLDLGEAFDVTVQAAVISRDKISRGEFERSARYRVIKDGEVSTIEVEREIDYYRTTMRYTFTNAKPVPTDVQLTQAGLDRGWWSRDFRVVSEDVAGEQLDLDRRRYTVTVPANGKRVVEVTYETKY
ncbi:DUF4139 domain-containing protein [Paraurantiacibacter namhicola]|uniref:DUF4139 domain-containing protein n=1 Tax=Paraurantiacibacter namhicola TaxID=645517 RepID=A0A1C7D875_9SPHN|nr:DUF4139 domain-containing protein [Paraurantiacibacter namhicola]ANU07696.1 hypothetical protein A6F65_01390 [Paraurantiacibacter namhicola]